MMCLQVSPVDADAAVDLGRLIVQIDKEHPSQTKPEWMVSYRKDTPRVRVEMIMQGLCDRFPTVFKAEASHFANGWPAGSNALWRSTMEDVARVSQAGELEASGVLTFEPDCCPLSLDWIDRLVMGYGMRLQPIMGNLHNIGTDGTAAHINGNAMWPVDLATRWPEVLKTPMEHAWDWYHRAFFLPLAEDTPLIMQLYRRKNLGEAEWKSLKKQGVRPALLHGIKDGSARALARMHLLAASPGPRSIPRPNLPKPVTKGNL